MSDNPGVRVLTTEDLSVANTDAGTDRIVVLAPLCHGRSPVVLSYDRQERVLRAVCFECGAMVSGFALADSWESIN